MRQSKPNSDRNEQLGVLPTSAPFSLGWGGRGGASSDSEEEIVVFVLTNKASALPSLFSYLAPRPKLP